MTGFNPRWRKIAAYLGIDFLLEKLNIIIMRQRKLTARIEQIEQRLGEMALASRGPDKGTQTHLTLRYRELAAQGTILPFEEVEFRNYSQFGEDGILHYIFSLIGTHDKRAVEFCAGIGSECNAANLIINHGWTALLVDGDEDHVAQGEKFFSEHPDTKYNKPLFLHRWITRDNINDIIRDTGFDGEIDLFSLDMDGVDYWIWEAVTAILPRVIILEVNPHMGEEAVTVPYADDFTTQWIRIKERVSETPDWADKNIGQWTMYGGASLAAFNSLAKRKGYRLVGCNRFGSNVIFLRNDVGTDYFQEVSENDCKPAATLRDRERGARGLRDQTLIHV